jgi:hypothetical protein
MYCVGWKQKSNCRPVLDVEVGDGSCPQPGWFYLLAIGAAAWALTGKKGKR